MDLSQITDNIEMIKKMLEFLAEETPTNTPKTLKHYKEGCEMGSFSGNLLKAFEHADEDNRRRLMIAFPRLFENVKEEGD